MQSQEVQQPSQNAVADFCLYQRESGPPLASVKLEAKLYEEWFEILSNDKPYYFDDALAELDYSFKKVQVEKITFLKHHANTWGLSSSNWLADEILPKLKNLTKIDFSETLGSTPRSDICHSVNSMLNACKSFAIEYIDLRDNFLDYDGARAFKDFISCSKHLQILRLDNCKLGPKSSEMILNAVEQNPGLKLK